MERTQTLQLNRLEDEIKKIVRRIETMQKSLDLLYEDRSILEDIVAKVNTLQEQFQLNRNRAEKQTQDIKYEVQGVSEKMTDSVTEVGDKVERNIGVLVKEIKTKDVVVVKANFFDKIKRLFKH